MHRSLRIAAASLLCLMLTSMSVLLVPTASAGQNGAITVANYDHLYVYTTSGGYENYEYIHGRGTAYYAHDITANRAMVVTSSDCPGDARAHATVYQEFRFKPDMFGYVTFTVNGYYSGRVGITGVVPGDANIWWYLRLLDLNNHFPNDIISEVLVKHLNRNVYGTETIGASCSATFRFYLEQGISETYRLGIAAQIVSATLSADILGGNSEGNAFAAFGATWGMWINSIEVQAPSPAPACVLKGTPIMLADGSMAPVETLKKNTAIMGYDLETGFLLTEKVVSNKMTIVAKIEVINDGLLKVTLTNQPIYARHDGVVGWVIDPQDLKVGWELLNPVTGEWILITSIEFQEGRFAVYDLVATAPDNYIANGLLLDHKRK